MRSCLPLLAALASLGAALLPAQQRADPVQWSLTLEPASAAPGGTVRARLSGRVQAGYHVYSLSTPLSPNRTVLTLADSPAVRMVAAYQGPFERKPDPTTSSDAELFNGDVAFLYELQVQSGAAAGPAEVTAQVKYQACTDTECLRPMRRTASATLTVAPGVPSSVPAVPAGFTRFDPAALAAKPAEPTAPVPAPDTTGTEDGLGRFLLVAFGFGLAAIFTPCVFPMIPITMSFFLNQGTSTRRQAVTQALVFCAGIVVLFSLMGLAITAIAGPFGVVQLGSSPWVNGLIAALFLAFGFSLLGAFEITLPSGLLTRLNSASQRGGVGGTLLMGLAFSLTSFACVGPFVGTLLAASVQSKGAVPLLGMVAFASGLASPFFFLALFPQYLKRLPRSGGWMARVKVVLGFVVLAAALKYLSNIDQVLQLGLLPRETFLAFWVVLFLLPGLYLLGLLRMEGIRPDEPVTAGRLLAGSLFLVFAVSLLPGLFGGRLGELEAYVPASTGQSLSLAGGGEPGVVWRKNQYREALAQARQEGKRVLVNFTGYACTNCHWMKANMFPRTAVRAALGELVLVELYTDGSDPASEENQTLQEQKFASVAIPYYAILDADERVVARFAGLTRDEAAFVRFLQAGGVTQATALR